MKKYNTPEKPSIKIMLTKEMFNALWGVFAFFKVSEKHHGKSFYSHYSELLERKIMRHGRFIENKNGEFILIFFFTGEVAQLVKVLLKYVSLRENSDTDYFADSKMSNKK